MYLGNLPPLTPIPPIEVGGSSPTSEWGEIGKAVAQAAGSYAQLRTWQDLQQINIERARRGEPPLNTSQYQSGIPVQLDAQTQQLVTFGIIGLLFVLLLR